jgi:hypothetical protein
MGAWKSGFSAQNGFMRRTSLTTSDIRFMNFCRARESNLTIPRQVVSGIFVDFSLASLWFVGRNYLRRLEIRGIGFPINDHDRRNSPAQCDGAAMNRL